MLEDESEQSIFDWIRDYKDYDIRQSLKHKITELTDLLKKREDEIMRLRVKQDDYSDDSGFSED